jgi:hypothetical protein
VFANTVFDFASFDSSGWLPERSGNAGRRFGVIQCISNQLTFPRPPEEDDRALAAGLQRVIETARLQLAKAAGTSACFPHGNPAIKTEDSQWRKNILRLRQKLLQAGKRQQLLAGE